MTEAALGVARASAMLELKRYDQAASLLAVIVAADPESSRAWCLLARAHAGNGRYQEAAAAASRAAALDPADDWPHRLISNAHLRTGNLAAAIRAATQACRLAPHEWRAQLCLAQAALGTHAHATLAEQAAANARAMAPNEPDAHFVSGQVSLARGDRKVARAHQERALALDPAHSGALNELGRIKMSRARSVSAARHFLQAARAAPQVSSYGHNVEVVVRRTVALVIYVASVASFVLTYLAIMNRLPHAAVAAGLTGVALVTAAFGGWQLLRMPPETRPLFRRRRIVQALAVSYGAIGVGVVVAAVTPGHALPGALVAVTAVIIAARFAAYAILRREVRDGRRP